MKRSNAKYELENMDENEMGWDRLAEIYTAIIGYHPPARTTLYQMYSELCFELDVAE